jgi:hypothetical protein
MKLSVARRLSQSVLYRRGIQNRKLTEIAIIPMMKIAATIGKVNKPCCIRQTITAPMMVMIMTVTRSIRVIRPIMRPLLDIQLANYFLATFSIIRVLPCRDG